MNNFKDNLKVEIGQPRLKEISVHKNTKEQELQRKFKKTDSEVIEKFEKTVISMLTDNTEDNCRRLELLSNVTRIIENYEELRPIMIKFFNEKRKEMEK